MASNPEVSPTIGCAGRIEIAEAELASARQAGVATEAEVTVVRNPKNESAFWLEPAALPTMSNAKQNGVEVHSCATATTLAVIRLAMPDGFSLTIELPRTTRLTNQLDVQALISAAQPLSEELRKQKLVD